VALRTTCVKNAKFKVIKIRTGCQYVGYFYYSGNLNWTAQNLRLGRMRTEGHGLDIADLEPKTRTAGENFILLTKKKTIASVCMTMPYCTFAYLSPGIICFSNVLFSTSFL